MSFKYPYLWGVLSLLSVILSTPLFAAYDINNGGFELYDYNSVLMINFPRGWQRENYTAVKDYFQPSESAYHWLIRELYPFDGNEFLLLSSGDIPREVEYARVHQNITVAAGDTLLGAYFFGTYDWTPFGDTAEIRLTPISDPCLKELKIVHINVSDVNSYGSMAGWKRFSYTFDTNQAGDYNLTAEVKDYGDFRVTSYLAVDGLKLCSNASGKGDLNLDCTTDFQDFSKLADSWMLNCDDSAIYPDANLGCFYNVDISGNGFIDYNDLETMSQYWLEGAREEEDQPINNYYGDMNADGKVDMNDIPRFFNIWLVNDCNKIAQLDYNGDCIINYYEFSKMTENWLKH